MLHLHMPPFLSLGQLSYINIFVVLTSYFLLLFIIFKITLQFHVTLFGCSGVTRMGGMAPVGPRAEHSTRRPENLDFQNIDNRMKYGHEKR